MKGSAITVSVIVPCYNEETVVENCIASLLKQDYNKYEVVIVDDGSTDRTSEIARKYRVKLLRLKKNGGIGRALNAGINAATGEVVEVIAADCTVPGNHVRTVAEKYSAERSVCGVGGTVKNVAENSFADNWRNVHTGTNGTGKTRAKFLIGMCSSYRKKCLQRIGGFDPFFRTHGDDVDIGLRLNKNGCNLVYDPKIFVFHHRQDDVKSLLKSVYRSYYYGYLAFFKTYGLGHAIRLGASSISLGLLKRLKSDVLGLRIAFIPVTISASALELLAFLKAASEGYPGNDASER